MMLFLLLLLLTVFAGEARATDYYVALGGSGSTCSFVSPCGTIAVGITKLTAGDTLFLRGGTYSESINSDSQTIPTGTAWDNAVTIASYPGESATLRPNSGVLINFNTYNSAYDIKYLVFDRLILDGSGAVHVVSFTGNPAGFAIHHIRIQNSELKNSVGDGIDLGAINQVTANSHHNEWLNNDIHHSAHSYGFYIGGDANLVDGNSIHDNAGYALQLQYAGNGIIVRNNRMYNNGFNRQVGCIVLDGGDNDQVYNNLIYNNNGGITVRYNTTGHFPDNTQIYNNTLYNNGPGLGGSPIGIEIGGDGTHPTNTQVKNNILWQSDTVTNPGGINTDS